MSTGVINMMKETFLKRWLSYAVIGLVISAVYVVISHYSLLNFVQMIALVIPSSAIYAALDQ